jgi:glycosyltransferase involved in cell wall biosynthesis
MDVVLVGSAPVDDPIQVLAEQVASQNPRVHLVGRISDDDRLFALWQHAAVYFHGHTVGGTNPALVQAMALGARTVARDTVFNREVLGDAAVFCDGTPTSIAAAVLQAIDDVRPLETMAKERAQTSYSWQSVLGGYDRLLTFVIHDRR